MKYFTKEVKIGLTSIAALFILIYGINYLKGIDIFKPSSYIFVKYNNVNGLSKSSPVFADGVKVGIVRDIHYNYQNIGEVVVEVEIDSELRIPEGSSAELVTGIMGDVRMNLLLTRGSSSFLAIGDTIRGRTNKGMAEQVGSMMPQFQELVPKLDSILISINNLLADPLIHQTLVAVHSSASSLNSTTKQLNTLMNTEIPQLTTQLNTVGNNLVSITDNIKLHDFASTFRKIDTTIANLEEMTEKLTEKDNTLGLLLNDSSLYQNLNQASLNAASLLKDLKEEPKRYVHFSIFGRKNK